MPELPVVGQVANPDELDLETVIVPIAAYTIETKEEVIERFPFRPLMPPGIVALVERMGGQTINVNGTLVVLRGCLIADAAERFDEFLDRPDLAIEAETLASVLGALLAHYGERPTKPSSGSSRTGRRSGRTSKAARPSAA